MFKVLAVASFVASLASIARAEDATLVISTERVRVNRALPAGVAIKLSVPIANVDPTNGLIAIYPKSGDICRKDPSGPQFHEYGASVAGTAGLLHLEATVSPLQIATIYCIEVSYEHGLSTDKLNALAEAMTTTKIDWDSACAVTVPSPTTQRVPRDPAEQIERVQARLHRQLTTALGNLHETSTAPNTTSTSLGAAPDLVDEAVNRLTVLLDVPARCIALERQRADEERAVAEHKRATAQQRVAAEAVKKLRVDVRSWPTVVLGPANTVTRLFDALNHPSLINGVVAHVDLADHAVALDLAELADPGVTDAVAKRARLRAKLEAPPAVRLPVVLYLPTLTQSTTAADLFGSDMFDRGLLVDLVKNRDIVLRQLEWLRGDKVIVDHWLAALGKLADEAAAAVDAARAYDAAKRARSDAEASIGPVLKQLMLSETIKGQLRRTKLIRDQVGAAERETDDKASWIAPNAGILVAFPRLLADGAFADPWLTPYLGASIYGKRVDRVIDVDDLVGDTWWQKNSFTVGLLVTRPKVRGKEVVGPWTGNVVPFLGFGHRLTQYLRFDVGALVFQYSDRVPTISDLHWGIAGWAGVSLDADVWAVASGKLGK
jgi:hypothetical protein